MGGNTKAQKTLEREKNTYKEGESVRNGKMRRKFIARIREKSENRDA